MTESAAGPGRAVRLICAVGDDGVRVVSRRALTKAVPPSEPLEEASGPRSGFWIEVRGADEQVRYRRVVPDPLAGEVEVPGDDGSFTRRRAAVGSFAVLVPDLPGAEDVVLVRGEPAAGDVAGVAPLAVRAEDVARLPLHGDGAPAGTRS